MEGQQKERKFGKGDWFSALVKFTFPVGFGVGMYGMYASNLAEMRETSLGALKVLGYRGLVVWTMSALLSRWTFEALCIYDDEFDRQYAIVTITPYHILLTLTTRMLHIELPKR